ncbi:MAG: hypothetical protein AAFV53_40530, partial [Myxococcota bacterium]
MAVDPDPVLAALEAALAASPHIDLRIAVAERLLALDRPDEALPHLTAVLDENPAHLIALDKAAHAAAAVGQLEKAGAWRRLHTALSGNATPAPAPEPRVLERQTLDGPAGRQDADGAPSDADNVLRLVSEGVTPPPEDPDRITFDDVGGLDAVKRRVELSFLMPLKRPDLYQA